MFMSMHVVGVVMGWLLLFKTGTVSSNGLPTGGEPLKILFDACCDSCPSTFDAVLKFYGDLECETELETAAIHKFLSPLQLKNLTTLYTRDINTTIMENRRQMLLSPGKSSTAKRPKDGQETYGGCSIHDSLSSVEERYALSQLRDSRSKPLDRTAVLPKWSQNYKTSEDIEAELLSKIRNKVVVFAGDSTLRQQFGHFWSARLDAMPTPTVTEDSAFQWLKNLTRDMLPHDSAPNASHLPLGHICNTPQPSDWEFHYTGGESDAGYRQNEHTTSVYFEKHNATLVFDFKKHTFTRMDRWRIAKRYGTPHQAPDVLIVSPGLHDCFWSGSIDLGTMYHANAAKAFLAYTAAHLPAQTQLIWLSTQIPPARVTSQKYLRCVQTINAVAQAESLENGWFTYVDQTALTRVVGNVIALNKHTGRGKVGGDEKLPVPAWLAIGENNITAKDLSRDNVHYTHTGVGRIVNDLLASTLNCVWDREPNRS
eukprot:m.92384 g.92384  ORF g.92384 m.92384 type:complete len:483 (-) comp26541_c0_seq1:346-1794(-)